ncbi:MAG: universal stress protein [Vicinamibacterales bacterium]
MLAIRTVLCPVDFSEATSRQAHMAAALARLCGARLVLHHNLSALGVGAGVGWMWSDEKAPITEERVAARLGDLATAIGPGVPIELRITEGPASSSVRAVSEAVDADVVVLCTHDAQSDDHASVTATVLHHTHRAVLALHEPSHDAGELRLEAGTGAPQVLLVPTDFSPESRQAVEFAFDLARLLPLDVHLLHMVRRHESTHAEADRHLRALVPPDFGSRVQVHVREGDAREGIVATARDLNAACIVMGEHARSLMRRWFSSDTSEGVLHAAPCPVWYVPAGDLRVPVHEPVRRMDVRI